MNHSLQSNQFVGRPVEEEEKDGGLTDFRVAITIASGLF